MEIDITRFFDTATASDFSASRAERGQNAGPETWANAVVRGAADPFLTTPADLDAARDYFRDFGAWDDAERAAWTAEEVNALLIQDIAANIREAGFDGLDASEIDWDAYTAAAEAGQLSGNLFASGDKIYFYMGH